MSRPQVVFFGTGPVAAESLKLLTEWADIEAVITKPKPAHHKGSFPVLEIAEELKLTVLEVTDKKSLHELIQTNPVKSRLGILIDFGIIVSQDVIDYFADGIINSHFSILPEWRGADPISFSILSGQDMTGVSIMRVTAGLDEGPLLGYGEQPLDGSETTPVLTERLIDLSDALLKNQIPLYITDDLVVAPQSSTGRAASYSRKLSKADSTLDFSKPADQLANEVRAFIEWPKSRAAIGGKDVVITTAHVIPGTGTAGDIWQEAKQFGFYTSHGIFVIDTLKPAGKGDMSAAAFLSGYKI
ncbi:hypothetical protein H7097_00415 [Aeromicrobium sp.]|nr:hypothetical protein [Candidatus Saccharibacteria bacterium]